MTLKTPPTLIPTPVVKREQPAGGAKKLSTKLENDNVAASFDSLEGIETITPVNSKPNESNERNFIRDTLPPLAYAAASAGHVIAGLGQVSDIIPSTVTENLDKYALKFSKLVNVGNYTYKGVEAVVDKRATEGIARLAYSAIVPWTPLESVFTFSGVSSGLTMFEQAQRHLIKYENASGDDNGSPKSIKEDLVENAKAFKQMFSETFKVSSLIGKDRKIFFNTNKRPDEGHTMFFSAWGNILGAALGMIPGVDFASPIGKASALVRNGGGIGCDWAKFIHPDKNNKISAVLYGIVSIFDVSKSFTEEDTSHTLSHFSMGFNNFANYYYVNTTKATKDKTFQDIGEATPALAA